METNAQPQAIENAQPQATQEPAEAPKVKYKYNHQDVEEVFDPATYQKGKNYDKIHEKLQAYEQDESLKILDEIANEYKVPKADLVKRWKAELAENSVKEYAEQYDIPPEVAKELIDSKRERDLYKNQYLTAEQIRKKQEHIENQIKEFKEAYPDVKDADIPDSVIEMARDRQIPLKIAYEAYLAPTLKERVEKMEQELKVKNVNEENSASSMGSAASAGDTQIGEFTEESVAAMTSEQRRKLLSQPNSPLFKWLQKRK